jgi:hypothetical protein
MSFHLPRRTWLVPLVMALLACALSASTWRVFGNIWDEPEHIAAGICLLDRGQYLYDDQHPPLARLAAAVGPYLAGARAHYTPPPNGEPEGRLILYHSAASYDTLLNLARLGMLPFLIILVFATWSLVHRWIEERCALPAVALLVATPVILGHAGVVALDVPVSAMCMLAFVALLRWADEPTVWRTVALGLAVGLAVSTKMSAIPFMGLAGFVVLIAVAVTRRRSGLSVPLARWALTAPLALLLVPCVGIAVYGDQMIYMTMPDMRWNKAIDLYVGHSGWVHDVAYHWLSQHRVPIGVEKLALNILGVEWHNFIGHRSYLLGQSSVHGWWYFYLVALAVKTPLPLLLLGLPGLVALGYAGWRDRAAIQLAVPLWFAAVLAFSSLYSHINIGVRHVLILYPLLAIGAAWALIHGWQKARSLPPKLVLAALAAWQLVTPIIAYPDYLAYFNFIAGDHPEQILVDSDLDWGQDMRRLSSELARLKVPEVYLAYRGNVELAREGLPPFQILAPNTPVTGWVAVSMLALKESGDGYHWLSAYTPVERVGKSIDLYHIAAAE